MRRRTAARAFAGAALLAAAAAGAVWADSGSNIGSNSGRLGMYGTWDVVRVAVDPADQPRWTWRPDDPQLLGREVVIAAEALQWDVDGARCNQPQWNRQPATWPALLASSFPRPPAPGRAAAPTPAQMGLDARVDGTGPISVQRPRCTPDADGRIAAPWDATWLVQTATDRLLLRHGQALLHLARRAPGATPRPSFACSAAKTPGEQALCADVALAAWDRSVAQAWREARARRADDLPRLQAEQRAWLVERERCGADSACLRERMQERVLALSQE